MIHNMKCSLIQFVRSGLPECLPMVRKRPTSHINNDIYLLYFIMLYNFPHNTSELTHCMRFAALTNPSGRPIPSDKVGCRRHVIG